MDEITRCYQLLGLPVDASQEDVKRAYRDLVRVWHPDRFAHDERLQTVAQDKLKEINGAYETLNAKFFNDSISPPPPEEASQAAPESEFAPAEEPNQSSAPAGSQSKRAVWVAVSLVCIVLLAASGIFYWKHRNNNSAPIEPVAVYHPELKDFELILHATSATFTGNWTLGKVAKDRHNKSYHYASTVESTATATATFTPLIPATGNYDVYVWYSQGPKRSKNAFYEVFHDGTNAEAHINQTTKGGRWCKILSEARFIQGTNGYIRLSNNTGETDCIIIADALRLVYSEKQ